MRAYVFAVFFVVFSLSTPAGATEFSELVVIGEIPEPEIAVYITRQNLNKAYDLNLEESFLPKIIKALEFSPF